MRIILLALVFLPSLLYAAAPKPVTQRICMNNKTGSIIAKAKCNAGETTLTGQIIQAMAGAGPQGIAGIPGVNGTFDPKKCSYRYGLNVGTTVVTAEGSCGSGEFVQTHGVQVNYSAVDIIEIGLLFPPNSGVATGVEYKVGVNIPTDNTLFSVQVDLVCCRP
jgi:hypothetical protein